MKFSTFIKRAFLRFIENLGYELKGKKRIIKHNNFDSIINFLLKKKDIEKHIYFDVGANLGQSIERFKKINPISKIHSFEPTPELYNKLKEKYANDKNVNLNGVGIGDNDSFSNFYTYKHHKVNSFIPIDRETKFWKSRVIATNSSNEDFEKKIKVDITTIDNYCKKNNITEIDYIKVDTQGKEQDVLKGMKNLIEEQKVSIIELELIIGFGYNKNFSFLDYENILIPNGYRLIALDNAGNILSYSNYQANLLYVNAALFKEIEKMHKQNINIEGITNKTDKLNPFSY